MSLTTKWQFAPVVVVLFDMRRLYYTTFFEKNILNGEFKIM
jgi:hypothetical protein